MRFPLASLLLRPCFAVRIGSRSGQNWLLLCVIHPDISDTLKRVMCLGTSYGVGAMRGVEGAASFSFRGKFPGHFLPLSQAKNSANKPLLHTVKRKPPAVHLYSQATASPLCVISEAVRKP